MSSRGSHTSAGTYDSDRIAVEDAIVAQLAELQLVRARNKEVSADEEYELDVVMEEVANLIESHDDGVRRAKLSDLVGESFRLRKMILCLRRLRPGDSPPLNYYDHAMNSLEKVTSWTYDGEYRKAAIVLGVVEAGAELLILEVRVWGAAASMQPHHTRKGRNERRDVRKQIASVLTNLTFGSASMKKLIAEYDGFIPVVIELIESAPNLVPSYANLLRNVSWPSCKGMHSLYAACPALARAAVEANLKKSKDDDKAVKSTLSAIWNIVGSGGDECVRAIVREEGCVPMMIGLLTQDAYRTLVVEYSTGILKHAAGELVRKENLEKYAEIRVSLVHSLFPLLRGSSLTIVKNALTAINEIAAKDQTTVVNCLTHLGMDSLEKLQRSNDNDMRRPAKAILSAIGAGDSGALMSRSAHVGPAGRDMSSSMRSERMLLLPRRSPFVSPSMGGGGGGHALAAATSPRVDSSAEMATSRASSLPRHFPTPTQEAARGGGATMSSSLYAAAANQYTMGSPSPLYGNMDTIRAAQQQQQQRQQQQQAALHYRHHGTAAPMPPPPFPVPSYATSFAPPPGTAAAVAAAPPPAAFPSTSFAPPPSQPLGASGPPTLQYGDQQQQRPGVMDDSYFDEEDEDDDLSTQVTRAGSMLTLEEDGMQSQDISGFHSTVETANNSVRLSPVSYSDLPDSPTQCAGMRDQAFQLHLPPYPMPLSSTVGGQFAPVTGSPMNPFGMQQLQNPSGSSSSSGGALSSSQTHSSNRTTTSAEQTPTFANARYTTDYDATPRAARSRDAPAEEFTGGGPTASIEEGDDDYGVYGEDGLLDRSIEEALPQRVHEKRERLHSFLLDSLTAAAPSSSTSSPFRSPSSKGSSRYSNTSTLKEDDILAAGIEAAMPKMGSLSSPRGTLLLNHNVQHEQQPKPKNGLPRWSTAQSNVTTEGSIDQARWAEAEEEESDEESDLEYESSRMGGSLVGTMPRDVEEEIEAECIAIDCSRMRSRKPRPPRVSYLPRQLTTSSTSNTARHQATPTLAAANGRPSPRPSSIGRPRPSTSTPNSSKSRLNKFPATPGVSAVCLVNGNRAPEPLADSGCATPPPAATASPAPSSASSSGSMNRLRKPTASAIVPPYNYQQPKATPPRDEQKASAVKGDVEAANGILVTTV